MTSFPIDLPQEERELQQALAVQRMSAAERGAWLRKEWATAQANAQLFMRRFPQRLGALNFACLAEKNQYDEARELEQALNYAIAEHPSHAASAH